jgi:hypothetical protein
MLSIVAAEPEERADRRPDGVPPDLRRRLDAVFGDALPDVTRDERDDAEPPSRTTDEDLLADRPPHHDRP